MDNSAYFIAFPESSHRRLKIPMVMETDRFRGFSDDDRGIMYGYWDYGDLMMVQDTIKGKTRYYVANAPKQ